MGYVYVEDVEQDHSSKKPQVRLSGTDGNVFALMGECNKAMRRYQREVDPVYNAAGMAREMSDEIQQGDYDNALQVMMDYCDVS